MRRVLRYFLISILLMTASGSAFAGSFDFVVAGSNPRLDVKSLKETKFDRIVKQQFDFSCGSAALASLLTYHYDIPKTEDEVFLSMWEVGEQENIKKQGFSLLDMKTYLQRNNLKADGFKLSLDRVKEIGVPGIALIDVKGYKHFVVIKGTREGEVLLGDPSSGMTIKSDLEFNEIWDGTVFFIRSYADRGKKNFNSGLDWSILPGPNFAHSRDQKNLSLDILQRTTGLDSLLSIRPGL